jgi:hypothetical protein
MSLQILKRRAGFCLVQGLLGFRGPITRESNKPASLRSDQIAWPEIGDRFRENPHLDQGEPKNAYRHIQAGQENAKGISITDKNMAPGFWVDFPTTPNVTASQANPM